MEIITTIIGYFLGGIALFATSFFITEILAKFEDENKSDMPKPKVNKVKYQAEQEVKESKAMNEIDCQEQKQKYCSQCGSVISEADKFCGGCGEEIVKNEKNIKTKINYDNKITIISVFASLFIVGIIVIPIMTIIDKLEINGTVTLPDWLVTPVAILIVALFVTLLSPVNKFIHKKYKD